MSRCATAAHSRARATTSSDGRVVATSAVTSARTGRARDGDGHRNEPHRARLRVRASRAQLGGERDEHDRHRQIGGVEHGQGRVHAGVDRGLASVSHAVTPAPAATVIPSSSSRGRGPAAPERRPQQHGVAISRPAIGCRRVMQRQPCRRRGGQLGDVDRHEADPRAAPERQRRQPGSCRPASPRTTHTRQDQTASRHQPPPVDGEPAASATTATSTHHQPLAACRRIVIAVSRRPRGNRIRTNAGLKSSTCIGQFFKIP